MSSDWSKLFSGLKLMRGKLTRGKVAGSSGAVPLGLTDPLLPLSTINVAHSCPTVSGKRQPLKSGDCVVKESSIPVAR